MNRLERCIQTGEHTKITLVTPKMSHSPLISGTNNGLGLKRGPVVVKMYIKVKNIAANGIHTYIMFYCPCKYYHKSDVHLNG